LRRILLINPNMTTAHTDTMVAAARRVAPGDVLVDGTTVTTGVPLIVDEAGFLAAAAAVAEEVTALPADVDGVIVAAFADPALEVARARLAVPVVGIAEAAKAATAPAPFAVVTTLPGLEATIRRRARDYGAVDRLVTVRHTRGDGQALMADPERLVAALEALIGGCVMDGAAQIVVGGGPLADAARTLRERLPVPVVEPVPAALAAVLRALD